MLEPITLQGLIVEHTTTSEHEISTGLKVILPDTGEVNDGRLMIIKNNEAVRLRRQFPYINVVNNSDQNNYFGATYHPGKRACLLSMFSLSYQQR